MLIIILYFFIFIVAVQFLYYLGVFGKFAFAKAQKVMPKKIPISVIVCAKNEEENVVILFLYSHNKIILILKLS